MCVSLSAVKHPFLCAVDEVALPVVEGDDFVVGLAPPLRYQSLVVEAQSSDNKVQVESNAHNLRLKG